MMLTPAFILRTIQANFRQDELLHQIDLFDAIFKTYLSSHTDGKNAIEGTHVSKIFNDNVKLPQKMILYCKDYNDELAADLQKSIIPHLFNADACIETIYNEIKNDTGLPADMTASFGDMYSKIKNSKNVPNDILDHQRAVFLAQAMHEAGARPRNDDWANRYCIPKPCCYFMGRKAELNKIKTCIAEFGTVFLTGCQSIGKSEVAKAYADNNRNNYAHTVYVPCIPGKSLKQSIAALPLTPYLANQSLSQRVKAHMQLLKGMNEDTLLLIDNLENREDPLLPELQQLTCHVIITTRCIFNDDPHVEITEMEKMSDLIELVKFFSRRRTNTCQMSKQSSMPFTSIRMPWNWQHVC